MMLNAFHNVAFIFDNAHVFRERFGDEHHFAGDGTFIPVRPGRHMWETNFVPDLSSFKLYEWQARGAGSSNIMFVLANGTISRRNANVSV